MRAKSDTGQMHRLMCALKATLVLTGLAIMLFGLWVYLAQPNARAQLPDISFLGFEMRSARASSWFVFFLAGVALAIVAINWRLSSSDRVTGARGRDGAVLGAASRAERN